MNTQKESQEGTFVLAAFDLMYIVASSDGQLDSAELSVIQRFLNDHFKVRFEYRRQAAYLDSLTPDELSKRLFDNAVLLLDVMTEEGKQHLIEKILDVITADQRVNIHEEEFFQLLGSCWGIDTHAIIKQWESKQNL
jgi:uncharacterized tellurite resistance protein B-like protein